MQEAERTAADYGLAGTKRKREEANNYNNMQPPGQDDDDEHGQEDAWVLPLNLRIRDQLRQEL